MYERVSERVYVYDSVYERESGYIRVYTFMRERESVCVCEDV